NFANKLWNATRFVISMIGDGRVDIAPLAAALEDRQQTTGSRAVVAALPVEDRWILSRVETLARDVDALMQRFEMGEAARQVYDFVWGEFADWYIEIAKVRGRDAGSGAPSPLPVLAYVLDRSLRLLHPFMPFVTEELWQHLRRHVGGDDTDALIVAPYPTGASRYRDADAEAAMTTLIDVIRAIRNIRAEKKVEPAKYIEAYVAADG